MTQQLLSLPGIHPKEFKLVYQRDISTSMVIGALFIVAKKWKQQRCSPIDEWMV